jgi:iron complex outermembrane receptor protein
MLVSPTTVKAQSVDSLQQAKDATIDEVVVTAEGAPVSLAKASKMITVISRSEVERQPLQSIDALLENTPSIDARQRGGYGIQSDISIRGGNFEQTLILLNGINLSDPQTGHLSMNLPIDLASVDRIEILHGPAARIFGANAYSGVINLLTGLQPGNHFHLATMVGQYGLHSQSASLSLQNGEFKNYISLFSTQSDGKISNTDFSLQNLFYQGNWKHNNQLLEYQAGYNTREYGANSFYSAKYPNQFEKTKTILGSLTYTQYGRVNYSTSGYWRRNYDKFELFRDKPAAWYTGHNYHQTNVYGENTKAWFNSLLGKTTFGASFRREEILSNNIGTSLYKPIHISSTDTSYTKGYSRNYTGIYIDQYYTIEDISISAGILAQQTKDTKTRWDYFPGIDIRYNIIPELSVFAGYNTSLRMPSFTDLFYKGATQTGDINLKAEKGEMYETGIQFINNRLSTKLSGYIRNGNNLIDWVRYDSKDKYIAKNQTNIQYMGFEGLVSYAINYSFIQSIAVNYAYIQSNKESTDFQSLYTLDHLKNKLNIELSHKIWNKLSATWNINWQERKGNYTPYTLINNIMTEQPSQKYPSVWLVNVRIQWSNPKWNIYTEGSNLFDKKWYDIGSVEQPGFWLRAGFSYNLNF